ncbi:hypothetical protein HNP48_006344 [Acidovorax soli]|uniref:MBG domain-containing protein n=1 Tax=Acidovorax soli TaxID=592050 RepID=A0A7X0PKH0_9BURK|nr:hypothetical protein [Acidovorax soli]MBB6563620.1 hypothetical protein [Acidovorax soli]
MTHILPLHRLPFAGSRHRRAAAWLATVLAWLLLMTLAALCAPGRAQATSITSAASSSGGSWGGPGNNTWTPGGPGAVVAASDVNTRLAAGAHVVVQTHTSEPVLAIKAALTLTPTSHLELQAGGDVRIEAPLQAGTGTLTVRYGQQAVAAGNSATVVATAPVHLQSGASYTTRLGSDGADQSPTIITSLGAAGSNTGSDLQGMQGNLAGHYVLGGDIDASATSGWNGGAGFEPVGNSITLFTGSLDGLGHTITGLRIERPGQSFIGLFGVTSGARLRNIGLVNAQVRGYDSVGTLAGSFDGGTISSSYATGEVSSRSNYAGGLVGSCYYNCTISSSYATGAVRSELYTAGGLVGSCKNNCTISSSYATGAVRVELSFVGGLAGECYSGCTISSSYATGAVTGTAMVGGLTGICTGSCTLNNFYATTDAGGASINNGGVPDGTWSGNGNGTPKTLAELKTLATFSGWSIDDAGGTGTTWRIYPGQSTPLLRSLFTAPLAITATSGSRTVDGTTNALGVTYTPASPDARLLGTPVATAAGSAVGVHAITVSGVHSTQRGYDITLVPGTLTITAAVVVAPEPEPEPAGVTQPGDIFTVTHPNLPIVVGPQAGGATIVLPQGTGTSPVTLQISINGQPMQVQAAPGTQLRVTQVNGQNVLVLVVIQGWASMASTAAGQPMALAGDVLLSAGRAGTTIEAQPLTVAVLTGALLPPQGSLPQVGRMGLLAGERLQVNEQGALVSITLGSLAGNTSQPGDPMAFINLPASITVDSKTFARLNGPLARLSGVNLAQGLETNASGVYLLRDGGQTFQLLPTLPITIDATLPDGLTFTPLGLLRWVRGGVVVQFAPAVADLAGLASAVTAVLPGAQIRLGAEGVIQLRTGGRTYVLKPGWTGAGSTAGTPQIGVDEQGRIYLQTGTGPRQLLLPALLNATQANAIFQTALPGATLSVQPASNDGAFTVTLAGQTWRLVPQWVLPEGAAVQVPAASANWWLGSDGLLYLKLGAQVQGVRAVD